MPNSHPLSALKNVQLDLYMPFLQIQIIIIGVLITRTYVTRVIRRRGKVMSPCHPTNSVSALKGYFCHSLTEIYGGHRAGFFYMVNVFLYKKHGDHVKKNPALRPPYISVREYLGKPWWSSWWRGELLEFSTWSGKNDAPSVLYEECYVFSYLKCDICLVNTN